MDFLCTICWLQPATHESEMHMHSMLAAKSADCQTHVYSYSIEIMMQIARCFLFFFVSSFFILSISNTNMISLQKSLPSVGVVCFCLCIFCNLA